MTERLHDFDYSHRLRCAGEWQIEQVHHLALIQTIYTPSRESFRITV